MKINNPKKTVNITLGIGDSNVLVVPGYVIDGIVYDGLDLGYSTRAGTSNPSDIGMRMDNYAAPWTWPDADTPTIVNANDVGTGGVNSAHTGVFPSDAENMKGWSERELMFRNYMNLLTGFYIFRPDDPLGQGIEPLTGANRPLNFTAGPYYPSAGFYWPFDLVGLDQWPNFALINPTLPDPSPNGMSRAIAYSINMLSSNAAPEWSGELFYHGQNAQLSGATSQSSLMTSKSDWQTGMPGWDRQCLRPRGHHRSRSGAQYQPDSDRGGLEADNLQRFPTWLFPAACPAFHPATRPIIPAATSWTAMG